MSVRATWLGQAGFLLEWEKEAGEAQRLMIDPYLSDSLAEKYRGKRYPHVRMRQAPLEPQDVPPVLAVLCTHRHTDHMDPGTLQPLFAGDSNALLVAPIAEASEALSRSGVGRERTVLLDAGERARIGPIEIHATLAAHEKLDYDDEGRSKYLGYVVTVGDVRIYHSGDCVPFPGQADLLRPLEIDIALLPVNGRDTTRLENGVPGNFSFSEAVELCAAAGIPRMVAHHWGMFSFNTVDPGDFPFDWAREQGVEIIVPVHAEQFELKGAAA